MTVTRTAPYGTWRSPISSDLIVSEAVSLTAIVLDGDDTYWIESRPSEGGRSVLVRRHANGEVSDVTPPGYNVRTRVHEYGGGAYTVSRGIVYFSNFDDNRLYRQAPGSEPEPITAESAYRYADLVVDEARQRVLCVREDHSHPDSEADNTIVAVNLDGSERVLISGNNFYSNPRLSPDGATLAYLTWNHPNMPWDGTELWTASVAGDGSPANARRVAGGTGESIFQPEWSPVGHLVFASDRTGWWNLYRLTDGEIEALHPMDAEFGAPQWVFGMTTYAFADRNTVVGSLSRHGTNSLYTLNLDSGSFRMIDVPYTSIGGVVAQPGRAVVLAGSPTEPLSIVQIDLPSQSVQVLRRSTGLSVPTEYLSPPQAIEFPTENGLTAHALYYPPHNPDYRAPAGELPPLIVSVHGGPTGSASSTLNLSTQFWTSRGFGVIDVNYGGSTGYGREYRDRLKGQWGVVDVDDAVNAARYLVERGVADPDRLIIHGGSAGGYTTLAALAFRDAFAAGTSYFGIADLDPFVDDTHKFESRYTDGLVGPYPEAKELYRERSPINYIDQVTSPVLLFQGLDDKVVPPNQAEIMAHGLRARGTPFAYIAYEGEGHGFRRAENIKRTLDGELSFYAQVFNLPLQEEIEAIELENAPTPAG
ncbi:MAG TPA: S9 family peptidase [Chloroflexota bacterium]|nr:S9 family peptidase [Chloroflexota bacterium]